MSAETLNGTRPPPATDPEHADPDDPATALDADMMAVEVDRERVRRAARAAVDADDAPRLTWWGVADFLASPSPRALVAAFLYLDSLSRLFGAPGSAKTFVALDLALHVALGRSWCGRDVVAGPVVYVMAEGQAVNRDRVAAWLDHHGLAPDELAGRLVTVPHAVLLTAAALGGFLKRVRALGPVLVVLDTKNAMMLGNEDSAQDWATTRRALDEIRRACGACVLLVDHTGYADQTRARGSSAQIAAMDTEVRCEKDDDPDGFAPLVALTVTRDKAAEAGTRETLRLRAAAPAAVLTPADGGRITRGRERAQWADQPVPDPVAAAEGAGTTLVPELARFLAHDRDEDPNRVGVTRAEALRAIGRRHSDKAGRAAWSWLRDAGHLQPAPKVTSPTGRHVWTASGEGEVTS